MNILYLCDEYPPGKHGGIGTSVQLLVRRMVQNGHKVVVAGLYPLGYGGEDEFEDGGVKVYRFRRGFDSKLFRNEQSLASRISTRLLKSSGLMERDIKKSLSAYQKKLEQIITDYKIDIIEMPDYNDYIRFCRSYIPFPLLSVPVVIKMNGSITYFTKESGKAIPEHILKMEQTILNQASAVAATSRYTAEKSREYLSYPSEIEVLYNGINTNIIIPRITKNLMQVVFTGTLVEKKGIYQLAKAWNIVNKNMPEARLLILGKGPQAKVKALFDNNAIDTVSFMGHVATHKLYQYLAGSAVSIFPSYSEAFALAPLEAMACGTAVINSNRTSGPELVADNVSGLLINPDDINQIASAILHLLNDPAACDRLAKNGNERVKAHFEISRIAADNIRFYHKVLKGAD